MTIKEATERYNKEGEKCSAPALREVINYMIDRNIKTEFENDSYFDALTLTSLMFNRSTNSIRMLTGPQGDGFLKTLRDPLIAAIERIRANAGSIRVIILGPADKCLDELATQYPDTLKVYHAKATAPVKHFTVCDSKMGRMEELHGELTPETNASEIKAQVYFNDVVKAKMLEDSFDKTWNWLTTAFQKVAVSTREDAQVVA